MKPWLYIVLVLLATVLLGYQFYMMRWTRGLAGSAVKTAQVLRIVNIVLLIALLAFVFVTQLVLRR